MHLSMLQAPLTFLILPNQEALYLIYSISNIMYCSFISLNASIYDYGPTKPTYDDRESK
ncbi:uncharacterized protein RHIMIDRAFT_274062 [Rhizopus microsporus ATCC 52813]|uniref:Uncharacterized protein n=2 Tax=Rhizopus microsporus TaxID=58291 RepID=A0A2G4SG27_RHIZD|nr:uncharacterized protein RHIMIDRAFT_274062 [Rhizopus microsporus ATCC 52813]PHZ07724.1 hypothetical protein RHIMIDRAFT_274062 [Rhizopus microsporus ATCC 52813]